MLRSHSLNNKSLFIAGWYLDDTSICDKIIESHNSNPRKRSGVFYRVVDGKSTSFSNQEVKDSIDSDLDDNDELSRRYGKEVLQPAIDEYVELYPECAQTGFNVQENVNIQHYKPGGGYKEWHCERNSSNSSLRHLAFMTYLNTVNDWMWWRNNGGTQFKYQKLRIKAEKGLTLIWPTDWMHTHKGIISNNQDKYIATGWLHFSD